MSRGNILTFYSYKGGVGRTFALANVAVVLARTGAKVLVVDWDLEAPGLYLYFKEHLGASSPRTGVAHAVAESLAPGKSLRWRPHVGRVRMKEKRRRDRVELDFLCAGKRAPDYLSVLHSIDWGAAYRDHGLGYALEAMREEWVTRYDFVLVDSRTGISDVGGICAVHLPDLLVLVGTPNEQSTAGLLEVAAMAEAQRARLPVERSRLLTLPLLSRVEARFEYQRAQQWIGDFAKRFSERFAAWLPAGLDPRAVLDLLRIPSIPYWSFGEALPVLEERAEDPETISYAFETVAAVLASRLGDVDHLVADRDGYVAKALGGQVPVPAPLPPRRPLAFKPIEIVVVSADEGSGLRSWWKGSITVGQDVLRIETDDGSDTRVCEIEKHGLIRLRWSTNSPLWPSQLTGLPNIVLSYRDPNGVMDSLEVAIEAMSKYDTLHLARMLESATGHRLGDPPPQGATAA